MIVFTLTAQRFEDDKPVGGPVMKSYFSNGMALDRLGADATLDQQAEDESVMRFGYGRKGIELYRDLAFSLGVRRPGWGEPKKSEDIA